DGTGVDLELDESTMRARAPLPACPRCGGLARPNVLMFGDGEWQSERTDAQHRGLSQWLAGLAGRLVVVECGAGTAVPTVRWFSERLQRGLGATLVRVNPRESFGPAGTIELPMGAADATEQLMKLLS
ncbi:MAG: NAD-dependent deacetylase, partial [Deltaproteobacteria bacterium]|nr:NAD-dependent deacetylase [Deltaproteobacteria bacterium]